MSLVFKISPKKNYFSGNPIVFELQSDSEIPVECSVTVDEETLFKGICIPFPSRGAFEVKIDISEIFEGKFKSYIHDIIDDSEDAVYPILNFFLPSKVVFRQDGLQLECVARIFRGGVSNRINKRLKDNGYDIFSYRIDNPLGQFLFTTRTNSREIKIRETELFPFFFIHPGQPVVFRSENGNETVTSIAQNAGVICVMDVAAILKKMPSGTNSIKVYVDDEYVFQFNIISGKFAEEKYRLKFMNSLGAYEIIEVTGRAMHSPEFLEENAYDVLSGANIYEERRDRVKTKGIIEMETGYMERPEFTFVLDMIQSNEIYFIYPDETSFRCHVKADKVQYKNFMTEPTSVALKIMEVVEEDFSIPDLEFDKSDAHIYVDPDVIYFTGTGGRKSASIMGNMNRPFEVVNLPAWLHVENQTLNSFDLVAVGNSTEYEVSTQITVRLLSNPSVSAGILVTQDGAWLSQFIFDVVTTVPNENVARIVNLGAIDSGDAWFDYGDGTPVEIKTVPKSTNMTLTDQHGNPIGVNVGMDFGHVFLAAGTYTVTIKVRKGVDAFTFSSVPDSPVADWGVEFSPNPYIRTIRKIQSDSLKSLRKMFAGVVNGSFAADFAGLETPNITDVSFAFENFGNKGAYTRDDRMRFPSVMYRYFTRKDQITEMTRTYKGSGFEKIEKSMLSCSSNNVLLSVFECFREMRNVGGNWTAKYGNADASGNHRISYDDATAGYNLELEEFVETDLFWNQTRIRNFTGCFNAINDYYGNYDSGYSYKWLIKKDLFKGNMAPYLILDAMFNKCTRAIMENGFFADIAQKVHSMFLCFHALNDGNPRVGFDMSIEGFNGADLNKMFPDAIYPNMGLPVDANDTFKRYMAGAFDFWPSDAGDNGSLSGGFQCLPFGISYPTNGAYSYAQKFNADWIYWRYGEVLRKNNFSIASFLAKFPNVTATSGIDVRDNITVIDGAAYNFGNYTQLDDSGQKKCSDIDTFAAANPGRSQVIQKINLN